VDDARCRCSFIHFRDCWALARNEVLRLARNIRRIALARHSIRGGNGHSRHLRSSARGLAVLPPLGQVGVESLNSHYRFALRREVRCDIWCVIAR
jgi:hypothetical protein